MTREAKPVMTCRRFINALAGVTGVAIAALTITALTIAAGPVAAQMVSYRYDGLYLGAATPSPGLSDPACGALPLTQLDIRDGALRAFDSQFQIVKGIITHDGFFNADYYFPDGRRVVFEGTIDGDGRLLGGVMDGGCVWIVDLKKVS